MADEVNLCSVLLKQHFGEVVEEVGTYLIKWGARSLRFISRDVKYPLKTLQIALSTLLHHNLAIYICRPSGVIDYEIISENVLLLLRYPKYIYSTKLLYGDIAEIIVEEILCTGRLQMSSTIQFVLQRLTEITAQDVCEKFKDLVSTHFIRRCPEPVPLLAKEDSATASKAPNLSISKDKDFILPDINLNLITVIVKSEEMPEEPPAKRLKQDQSQPDLSIYWSVNFDRFHQLFRDQNIVKIISKRIDPFAGEIIRAMLRRSEVNTQYGVPSSNPVSKYEITDLMKKDNDIQTVNQMDSYLAVLVDDATKIINKFDDRSGGMFVIDFQNAIRFMAEENVTAAVQDRYGSKCCRIFKLLLLKKYLDQKQIEEMSMIPPKDAKDLTYKMMKDSIVATKEIPQTPDFAPSRTFFLFYIDFEQVCRKIIVWIYKAIYNATSRRMVETKNNKRLLEKQKTVQLIIKKLENDNASNEQIEEMRDVITHPEKEQLENLEKITKKLDACVIQMDDTLFALKSYIKSIEKSRV